MRVLVKPIHQNSNRDHWKVSTLEEQKQNPNKSQGFLLMEQTDEMGEGLTAGKSQGFLLNTKRFRKLKERLVKNSFLTILFTHKTLFSSSWQF